MTRPLFAVLVVLLCGCAQSTRSLRAVEGFEPPRYMGTWYEIARLPNSFEKGMTHVKADYSLNPDGTVSVWNSGLDTKDGVWRGVIGHAKPAGRPDVGLFKVTFFWPFYAPYKILDLDKENYSRALVTSGARKYLWILFREPSPPEADVQAMIDKAAALGFDVTRLERIDHTTPPQ